MNIRQILGDTIGAIALVAIFASVWAITPGKAHSEESGWSERWNSDEIRDIVDKSLWSTREYEIVYCLFREEMFAANAESDDLGWSRGDIDTEGQIRYYFDRVMRSHGITVAGELPGYDTFVCSEEETE